MDQKLPTSSSMAQEVSNEMADTEPGVNDQSANGQLQTPFAATENPLEDSLFVPDISSVRTPDL